MSIKRKIYFLKLKAWHFFWGSGNSPVRERVFPKMRFLMISHITELSCRFVKSFEYKKQLPSTPDPQKKCQPSGSRKRKLSHYKYLTKCFSRGIFRFLQPKAWHFFWGSENSLKSAQIGLKGILLSETPWLRLEKQNIFLSLAFRPFLTRRSLRDCPVII